MRKGRAIINDSPERLSINCADYNVGWFDGADYEWDYKIDEENRKKLEEALKSENLTGTLKEMIIQFFGECLDKNISFGNYCKKHGIKYELFTWVS